MKNVKLKPNYRHLVQKVDFCGPACVQMVLFRRGIWLDQELLAYKLGAKISKKYKNKFILPFKTVPSKDAGIYLKDFKKEKIKKFFRKYKLKIIVYEMSKIKNINEFILENLKKNNDIIINFWWKAIVRNKNWGHYVLLSEFDSDNEILTVCDPSPNSKSFYEIELKKILEGMSKKWDGNERGFILVKSDG